MIPWIISFVTFNYMLPLKVMLYVVFVPKNLFAQDYQRVVTFVCMYVAPCICVPCVYVPRVCPLSVYPLCVCPLSVHRSVYMSPVYVPWRTVDLEITRCFHIARSYVAS